MANQLSAASAVRMNKIRQILRMYSQGRSKLSIAEQTGISRNTAKKYMATFEASGLTFEQINGLNDKELDEFFRTVKQVPPHDRLLSLLCCFPRIDKEVKKAGETRYSLWESHKKEFPDGFGYTARPLDLYDDIIPIISSLW